jgi:hypothetical protein
VEEIKSLFEEFERLSFPTGLGGVEINGVELVIADADAVGLIDRFIKSKGYLSLHQWQLLEELRNDMNNVIEYLPTDGKSFSKPS